LRRTQKRDRAKSPRAFISAISGQLELQLPYTKSIPVNLHFLNLRFGAKLKSVIVALSPFCETRKRGTVTFCGARKKSPSPKSPKQKAVLSNGLNHHDFMQLNEQPI
jgi:hypothetical protein